MGEYVTKILKCFGCIEGDEPIGFPSANQSGAVNKDEVVAPYLQVMARFRADIRNGMKGDKSDLAKAVSCKVECIFTMVITSESRLEHHREYAPHFKLTVQKCNCYIHSCELSAIMP